MNKLDSDVVLRIMREERAKQLGSLRAEAGLVSEALDVNVSLDGVEKKVISPGLKVRSKKDGTLCTVKAVGPDSVVLVDPNGQSFHVLDSQLEGGYDLD